MQAKDAAEAAGIVARPSLARCPAHLRHLVVPHLDVAAEGGAAAVLDEAQQEIGLLARPEGRGRADAKRLVEAADRAGGAQRGRTGSSSSRRTTHCAW